MSSRTIDVLVFIPLIPALPVLATWFLPWESWLPQKLPKKILGPYLLYCAFAEWHFHLPWWLTIIAVVFGIVVSVAAVSEAQRKSFLKKAQSWPLAEATLVQAGEPVEEGGALKIAVTYRYAVNGEHYAGSDSVVYSDKDASRLTGIPQELKIHYCPDRPDVSVLDR